jgi:ParB/RepB/Spo0J family partition protein
MSLNPKPQKEAKMPKLKNGGKSRSVALSQIVESENIRTHYADIEELAESIKAHGLIEPVAVKARGKNADGIEEYELVAGFRRRAAVRLLYDRNDGPPSIDAVVVTGDTITIQLVENLQRNDLTAKERERGIYLMAQSGLQNREIAARLCKGEPFISRNIIAYKIREQVEGPGLDDLRKAGAREAELRTLLLETKDKDARSGIEARISAAVAVAEKARNALIDTSEVSTQALNEIQGVEQKDLARIVRELIAQGGTVSVARQLMKQYNAKKGSGGLPYSAAETSAAVPPEEPETEKADDDLSVDDTGNIEFSDIDPLAGDGGAELPPPKPAQKKKGTGNPRTPIIPFDPPHKMVDANSVQLIIEEYKDLVETRADEGFEYKVDAAHDIWALLLDRL